MSDGGHKRGHRGRWLGSLDSGGRPVGLFKHRTRVRVYRSHHMDGVLSVTSHPVVICDVDECDVDGCGPEGEASYAAPLHLATQVARDADTLPPARRLRPYLTLDDGLSVLLDRTFVVGTDPVAPSSHPYAEPLAISDPADSTSATHFLVSPARDGAWIIGLHAGAGLAITSEDGRAVHLPPGQPGRATAGAEIHWGSRTLVVRG